MGCLLVLEGNLAHGVTFRSSSTVRPRASAYRRRSLSGSLENTSGRKCRRTRQRQMPVVWESNARSILARYMWNSSGDAAPRKAAWRAWSALAERSSIACLVTISSTCQPADVTGLTWPSIPLAYIALRSPGCVELPSCGTSASFMEYRHMNRHAIACIRYDYELILTTFNG